MKVASQRPLLMLTAGVIAFATSHSASAQTGAATALSSADSEQVGDIVVTAQRVSQSLQKVPVAVTVVTADDLQTRKLNDLSQITLAVPSFQIAGDNSFAIRGVGSLVFSANIDSSVGVSVDEVSLGVPLFMSNGILDDVARIEVLQGPQGLLFGRNASSGLLNIVSNRPRFDRIEAYVSGELDWRDKVPGDGFGYIARGTLNLPVSDNAALRFNILNSFQNPIAEHVEGAPNKIDNAQRRTAGRAKFLYEPAEGTNLYLIGDYSRERGVGGIFDRTYRTVAPVRSLVGPVLAGIDRVTVGPENLQYGADGDMYRSVDTYGLSLNTSFALGGGLTLTNISAWRAFDLDLNIDTDLTSASIVNTNSNRSDYNQYSNELRLALAPGGRIDGQIGGYGFYSALDTATVLRGSGGTANPGYIGRDNTYRQTLRSLAAFGQAQYHLTDAFQLIAGARVTNDRIAVDTRQNDLTYTVRLGPKTPPARQTYRNTNFSWKLGTQYDLTADVTGYLTYSRGYKGPSFNSNFSVVGQDLTIRPETVGDLELGLKTNLFHRRLRLNLAAFRENFHDFQVQALDIGTGVTATGNAGRVRSQGIEATAVAKPARGLTINAGATLLDSKFRSYVGAACYMGQPNCLANGTFDAAGQRTPSSARFTSNVQAIYEMPLAASTTGFIEGSYNYRSSINFAPNASPLTRLSAIDTFGASIGLRFDRFDVSVFCKNCTNKLVPTWVGYDAIDSVLARVSSTTQQWGYNSVRTIGLTSSARF